MSEIVAIVPVRAGSQRVIKKNTRSFADTTLLDLKLEILTKLKGLKTILVSTDCEECVRIAKNHGVDVHLREAYYAGSSITNDQHWRHIAEITPGETVFMAQTTRPLVKLSTFQKAIDDFNSFENKFDSFNSVTLEKKFFWLDQKPLNYDYEKTPKSQNLPEIVSLNFALTLINREKMIKLGNVVGNNPKFIVLDELESVDVDNELDFTYAEYLYSNKLNLNELLRV